MESIQLTAIKRQVAFLDSIGAVFNIEFDGQEFISKYQPKKKEKRQFLPWAGTGIMEQLNSLKIGQEINIQTPDFTTTQRLISYCSATCCTKFGAGACITATAKDGKSVNVLRVF